MSARSKSKYTMRFDSSSPDGPCDSVSSVGGAGIVDAAGVRGGLPVAAAAVPAASTVQPASNASEARRTAVETRFFIVHTFSLQEVHGRKGPHTGSRTSPASASSRSRGLSIDRNRLQHALAAFAAGEDQHRAVRREARRFFLAALRQHLTVPLARSWMPMR